MRTRVCVGVCCDNVTDYVYLELRRTLRYGDAKFILEPPPFERSDTNRI